MSLQKVLVILLFAVVIVIVIDALLLIGYPFSLEEIPFFAGKPKKTILSDLFFFEGAIILGLGGLTAAGTGRGISERKETLYVRPSTHVECVRTERKKQVVFGILIMIIGAVLIVLSVAVGSF